MRTEKPPAAPACRGIDNLYSRLVLWQVGPMLHSRAPSLLERALGAAVVAISWTVALVRGANSPQWEGDIAALRDLGLASLGTGGFVSTWVTQLFSLVPLGSRSSRASVAAATLIALAAGCAYRVARPLLAEALDDGALAALLASSAALTAALGPTWQAHATLGGGAAAALALFLCGLVVATEACGRPNVSLAPAATRSWLLIAVITAALYAESLVGGIALTFSILAMSVSGVAFPAPRSRLALGLVFAITALIVAAPSVMRPLAPRSFADIGHALSVTSMSPLSNLAGSKETVLGWTAEFGVVSLGLAALGLTLAGMRARARGTVLVLVLLPLVELVSGARVGENGVALLHALAAGALMIATALGVAELVRFLQRLELPMARRAAVLTVVFHMTLVAVVSDEASASTDRSARFAAEEWTDAALGAVDPSAAIVVRSPRLSFRLFSAQHVDGQRPDVLVIASPLLGHGAVMPNLLPREPDLAPLLRDLALTGHASEFGLSVLADARPLAVELDPHWEHRLVAHLALDGPWLRFIPEHLSAPERRGDGGRVLGADGRIAPRIASGPYRDTPSATVVGRTLKEHASALSLLGLTEPARTLLEELTRLEPSDPFARSARIRLAHAARTHDQRGVELRDLLRF
ncbi:MAG: hypothetical protein EXR75_13435 [Myxococcales bacterium]|nr:hypothetical protein [Myxococcales bacterium]